MRSFVLSAILGLGTLGLSLASPSQVRAQDFGNPAYTSGTTTVAWRGPYGYGRGRYYGPRYGYGYNRGYNPYGYGGYRSYYYPPAYGAYRPWGYGYGAGYGAYYGYGYFW
jgi:hypothetical protein